MLPAQSSLAESVDGDDVRSEDGGDERKGERPGGHYYCLYLYQQAGGDSQHRDGEDDESGAADTLCGEDFSLSLVDTNLAAEAEPELRTFIAKRLSRGALFEGVGNVSSVDLGSPDYVLGCYYCLIQGKAEECSATAPPEHIICFLGGSEKGLDLFRLELDHYVDGLKSKLKMGYLELEIRPYLVAWFEDSVLPIHRVVNLFQEKLAYLLYAALSYTPVEVVNSTEQTQNDISRFLTSASLQGLVQEGTMTSLCLAMTELQQQRSVTVDAGDGQPQLGNAVSNRFCEDWMQVFINTYDGGSPFLFRQKLENFKLKVIQDMNNLKRLIRQAESSHYALFRCYNFLKNCGNGDLLLQIVAVEHAELPEARSVVRVLEEFIREEGFPVRDS
ncbi:protein Njmu-R1-like [Bufo gargarizans]|uniref:protein Njmu-R1-like n=1 Tax=Bufo gargarizans TaxID=30331 RepID=UPI001CF21AC3|nr:protein Njmu-R1-like [Bufo gargarizans]